MWDRFGPRMVDHGWWPGIVGDLVPLLFLLVLVAFGVWAVRRITDQNRVVVAGAGVPAPAAVDDALHELRLRYARGELGRDEFVQRFRDLGGEGPEPSPPTSPGAA